MRSGNMSRKDLTVLIDADDVMWNLCKEWVNQLNKKYHTNVDWESINEWDMQKAFPWLTIEQIREPLTSKELWLNVEPMEYAVKTVKLMFNMYNTYVCTASCPKSFYLKYEYAIKRLFPFIPYDRIICTNNKRMVKADVLVDDYLPNLACRYHGILFTAPHNKNIEDIPHNCTRADGWLDAVYHVDRTFWEMKDVL